MNLENAPVTSNATQIVYKLQTRDKSTRINIPILQDDIDSLNDRAWLTDTTIEAYLHCYILSYNLFCLPYYMSTDIVLKGELSNVSRKVNTDNVL